LALRPGFERDHAEHTGLTLSGREIAAAAARGDRARQRRWHDTTIGWAARSHR